MVLLKKSKGEQDKKSLTKKTGKSHSSVIFPSKQMVSLSDA